MAGGTSPFLHFHSTFHHQHSTSLLLNPNYTLLRNGHKSKNQRSRVTVSSSLRQNQNDDNCVNRRALVFVGVVSVLPLLQFPARAVDSLVASDEQPSAGVSKEEKNKENVIPSGAPVSPILAFLNGIGIIGSGVLGAFYALARQEQEASEYKIESLTKSLSDKEAAFKSMQKNYESRFINEQEVHAKQLQKAKDEQLALITQLDSANSTIKKLGQELNQEKKALQEFQAQVDSLQTVLSRIREEKKEIEAQLKEKVSFGEAQQGKINSLQLLIKKEEEQSHSLASSLSKKESELNEMKAAYGRSMEELVKSSLQINKLEEELHNSQKELGLKISMIADLSAQISALVTERDNAYKKINELQKLCDDLKSDAVKKAELHAKHVKQLDLELAKSKEKLDEALKEVSVTKAVISDLTSKKDRLNEMLHMEVNQVKNLNDELKSTQGELDASKKEGSELGHMLRTSRQLCSDLESRVVAIQAELAENKRTLQKSLDEARNSEALLTTKLESSNELLKKTVDELKSVSSELAATRKVNDELHKQLVDVQNIVETATSELNEEKKVVAALKKELQNLEKQISIDKEARKSLETSLEETTTSLDQVNRNSLLLAKDIELAKSQISSLEDEKDAIYRSLAEQKHIAQSNRENLEDAHNLVMRLGTERENLDKKAKKLEDELLSAKGEILRLRSEMNSSKPSTKVKSTSIDNLSENGEVDGKNVTTSAKKTSRRKKSSEA